MSLNLIDSTNHRDGGILFSGNGPGDKDPHLRSVLRDMPLEMQRARQVRAWHLDPMKYGIPDAGDVGNPTYGDGATIGSGTAAHMDVNQCGVQGDGSFQLQTAGGANDVLNFMSPNGFKPQASTTMKLYAKLKIDDVSATDCICGFAFDAADANAPSDLIVDTTGAPGADFTDGIIFHREDGDAANLLDVSVYDGAANTNSTATLTLPTDLVDQEYFELGIVVHGVSSIMWVVKQAGFDATVLLQTRVASSVIDLLTSSLLKMGCAFSLRNAGASAEKLNFLAFGAIQTFA